MLGFLKISGPILASIVCIMSISSGDVVAALGWGLCVYLELSILREEKFKK